MVLINFNGFKIPNTFIHSEFLKSYPVQPACQKGNKLHLREVLNSRIHCINNMDEKYGSMRERNAFPVQSASQKCNKLHLSEILNSRIHCINGTDRNMDLYAKGMKSFFQQYFQRIECSKFKSDGDDRAFDSMKEKIFSMSFRKSKEICLQ